MELTDIELGPKMLACSERERLFVWHYLTGDGNGAEAARQAGYSDVSEAAKVRASQLLHRDRVVAALEEMGKRHFRAQLPIAIRANKRLLENEKHPDHAKTVQQTLSRLGLAEKVGIDVNIGGEITVNHTDQAVADLRVLIGLGVAREKLIEIFGFSGLTRYEKMLAEQERRALPVPVIDGEVVSRGE